MRMWHFIRHCLLGQNQFSEKEIQYFLEITICDPSIYTMNHPDLMYQTLWKLLLGYKGLNFVCTNLNISFRLHYKEKMEGLDCGDEIANWASDFLQIQGIRVVRYIKGMRFRDIVSLEGKTWDTTAAPGDTVSENDDCII